MSGPHGDDGEQDRTVGVELRESLHRRIAARVEGTDFETPDEYVEYAMEELLARVEDGGTETDADPLGEAGSGADDQTEAVEDRLESLGYL